MENTLNVKNFLIFNEAQIHIRKFTVFIGPQASGKSVIAKLIYLFYRLPEEAFFAILSGESIELIKHRMEKTLSKIFFHKIRENQTFEIRLKTPRGELSFVGDTEKGCAFAMSPHYENLIREGKRIFDSGQGGEQEEQDKSFSRTKISEIRDYFHDADWGFVNRDSRGFFVPAGRALFSTLSDNLFKLLSPSFTQDLESLDFFLVEFGDEYERFKSFIETRAIAVESPLIGGAYIRENGRDFIRTEMNGNATNIPIKYVSSGQQELLPIIILLRFYNRGFLIIEEPEAHIFPEAQDEVSRRITATQNPDAEKKAYLLTTHSPYVLNAINNMTYAGMLAEKLKNNPKQLQKLDKIYPPEERISPGELSAHFFESGTIENIIDSDTRLVNAEKLDSVSYTTGDKFSELLKLEQEAESPHEEQQ